MEGCKWSIENQFESNPACAFQTVRKCLTGQDSHRMRFGMLRRVENSINTCARGFPSSPIRIENAQSDPFDICGLMDSATNQPIIVPLCEPIVVASAQRTFDFYLVAVSGKNYRLCRLRPHFLTILLTLGVFMSMMTTLAPI